MKTKYKIVHELKNVKLILGNGYDLQCHLKTSYADYFLYDERKNNILRELLNKKLKKGTNGIYWLMEQFYAHDDDYHLIASKPLAKP